MTKLAEDINLDNYENYLTIGTLKEVLYSIPQEYSKCKVVVERIEDKYYEKRGWQTLKIHSVEYPEELEEYTPVWCANLDKENSVLRLFMHY
jgi:hypothetical protein